jgi:hypothetical protein
VYISCYEVFGAAFQEKYLSNSAERGFKNLKAVSTVEKNELELFSSNSCANRSESGSGRSTTNYSTKIVGTIV